MTTHSSPEVVKQNIQKRQTHGFDEEKRAFEASVAAGVTLFDTAAMYSGGASERRLGELARGNDVVLATKFPPSPFSRAEDMPQYLYSR